MGESKSIKVGDWAVTPVQNVLEREGRTVRIRPRAMEVLVYLVEHAGEVVSANELIDAVWQGRIVADPTVYQSITQLRHALGDAPADARYIETIPKRGYRLIATVADVQSKGSLASEQPTPAGEVPLAKRRATWVAVTMLAGLVAGLTAWSLKPGESPDLDQTRPEVHALYLQAQHILDTLDYERFATARDLLEQVVSEDSNYFPGHLQLARAYRYLSVVGQLDLIEASRLTSNIMERAATKWPDRAEIKAYRATIAWENGDLATFAHYLQLALQQDPSAVEPAQVVNILFSLGRFDQAVKVGEAAILHDPICASCYTNLRRAYYYAGEFERAIAITESASDFGLELPATNWYAANLLLSGDAEAALAEYESDSLPPVSSAAGRVMALHALGREEASQEALSALIERFGSDNETLPFVYSTIGNIDDAFDLLNDRSHLPPLMLSDPLLTNLREHPRFTELLSKAGIWPTDPREEIDFSFDLPE